MVDRLARIALTLAVLATIYLVHWASQASDVRVVDRRTTDRAPCGYVKDPNGVKVPVAWCIEGKGSTPGRGGRVRYCLVRLGEPGWHVQDGTAGAWNGAAAEKQRGDMREACREAFQ